MVGFCADLFDEIDERTHSVRLCLLVRFMNSFNRADIDVIKGQHQRMRHYI
ncbi:hypothetical protein Plhal703r1_c55g0160931 [Plasmopara halstedii]